MEHHGAIETEVKLKVPTLDGLDERFLEAGFVLRHPLQLECSVLWDRGTELLAQGCALRVRRYAGEVCLTWKGARIPDALLKIRPEEETRVADADALERILSALGFQPILRMEKRRAVLERGDLVACLDEAPFGCFLELEGTAEAIHHAMDALGLDAAAVETRSYPALFRAHGLA